MRGHSIRRSARNDIGRHDVHVWLATLAEASTRRCLAMSLRLLGADERTAWQELGEGRPRDEYLLTRVLLRTTLSRYEARAPESWRFVRTPLGRPELAPGQSARPLRFSVARRAGLVACAVTLGRDVGIDVEALDGRQDVAAIAATFFSPAEQRALRVAPPSRRRELFCRLWTRKEAWLKARGVGLSVPPADVASPIARRAWQWRLLRPTPTHLVAACVRTEAASFFSLSRAFRHDVRFTAWPAVESMP